MINIVCLKWGTKYGPEYVNRLYAGVRRHTTVPFKFWCFTDDDTNINAEIFCEPLQYANQLDSWWNKINLFSTEIPIPIGEQIFYVDLDTLIVDNIDNLLTDQIPEIVVLRDFYHGIAKTAGQIGSGLMSWKHGSYENIWQQFIADPELAIRTVRPHGDQAWVEHCINSWYCWQDVFPDAVVSFKVHCSQGIPAGAKIICYHGKPSIPESAVNYTKDWRWALTPQTWVLDHWRE